MARTQNCDSALLALKKAADEARAGGLDAVSAEALDEHSRGFREAASAGIALNAAAHRPAEEEARAGLLCLLGFRSPRGGSDPEPRQIHEADDSDTCRRHLAPIGHLVSKRLIRADGSA